MSLEVESSIVLGKGRLGMVKRFHSRWLLLLPVLIFTLAGAFSMVPSAYAHDIHGVLILDSTVIGGMNSFEAKAAISLGLSVTLVNAATWDSMKADQFEDYRAIVLGDPRCVGNPSPVAAAISNEAVWGPQIKGNVVVIGTDPSFHAFNGANQSGALKLIKDGIRFATNHEDTGAYISLSCYYNASAGNTPVPLLNAFKPGGFTVEGQKNGCPNHGHIVTAVPAFSGLTNADLLNWSCSIHEMFDKFPSRFQVLAQNNDNKLAYILVHRPKPEKDVSSPEV